MKKTDRDALIEAAEKLELTGEDPVRVLQAAHSLQRTWLLSEPMMPPDRWRFYGGPMMLLVRASEAEKRVMGACSALDIDIHSEGLSAQKLRDLTRVVEKVGLVALDSPSFLEMARGRLAFGAVMEKIQKNGRWVMSVFYQGNEKHVPALLRRRLNRGFPELSDALRRNREEFREAAHLFGAALVAVSPSHIVFIKAAREQAKAIRTAVSEARRSAPRGKKQSAAEAEERAWARALGFSSPRALARAMKYLTPKKYPMSSRSAQGEGPTLKPERREPYVKATHPVRSRRKAPRHDRDASDVAMERNGAEIHSPGHEPEGARALPRGGHQLARGSPSVRQYVRGNRRPPVGRVRKDVPP